MLSHCRKKPGGSHTKVFRSLMNALVCLLYWLYFYVYLRDYFLCLPVWSYIFIIRTAVNRLSLYLFSTTIIEMINEWSIYRRRSDMQIFAGLFLVAVMGLPLLITFIEYRKGKHWWRIRNEYRYIDNSYNRRCGRPYIITVLHDIAACCYHMEVLP